MELEKMILGKEIADNLIIIILIWIPLNLQGNIGMTFLQIKMKSLLFITVGFISFALILLTNIFLIYKYHFGIEAIFIANLWVWASVAGLFLIYFSHLGKGKISKDALREIVKFGAPFLPASIFGYILTNCDRYLLSIYASLEDVGVYALGYKIGMLGTMLLMEPFGKIWTPFLFENYKKEGGAHLVSRVFTIFILINAIFAIFISLMGPIIVPIISGKAFEPCVNLLPLLCTASILLGMASLSDAGILISKKTYYKPIIIGISAVICVGLNYFLIPHFKGMGAAISLNITFFIFFWLNLLTANRFFKIELEIRKISVIAGSYCLTLLISFLGNLWFNNRGVLVEMVLGIMLFSLFLVSIWNGGILSKEEKKKVFKVILEYKNAFGQKSPA